MMLPLVRTLQKSFPHVEITWCIGKPFYPLLKEMKGIHFIPIHPFTSLTQFLQEKQKIPKKRFDYLLAMEASPRAHLLYPFIRAKKKIGYDKERRKDIHRLLIDESIEPAQEHLLETFLRFGKHIGATNISLDSSIPLVPNDYKLFEQCLKSVPYYIINPCSRTPHKNWPLSRYVEVAEAVYAATGYTLVLTGCAKDQKAALTLKSTISAPLIDLVGRTSLREFAAILSKAKFLISSETGPVHLASALKTPVITLFAATCPSQNAPYFSQSTLINKYPEACHRFATKRQQKQKAPSLIRHPEAMQLIHPQDVIASIEKLLA